MSIESVLQQVQSLPFAMAIAESSWLFPTIESIHVLALTLVVGSISLLDLRLLDVSSRNIKVSQLANEVLPYTWSAFAVAATAGSLLFSSKAVEYYHNVPFRFKMACMALAGLNMLAFHFISYRRVHEWDQGVPTALAAKVAGGLSLICWIGVVTFGRWVGFV